MLVRKTTSTRGNFQKPTSFIRKGLVAAMAGALFISINLKAQEITAADTFKKLATNGPWCLKIEMYPYGAFTTNPVGEDRFNKSLKPGGGSLTINIVDRELVDEIAKSLLQSSFKREAMAYDLRYRLTFQKDGKADSVIILADADGNILLGGYLWKDQQGTDSWLRKMLTIITETYFFCPHSVKTK